MKHGFLTFCATLGGSAIVFALFFPNPLATPAIEPAPQQIDSTVSVLYVGDIMLDRGVALYARSQGDGVLFKGVEDLFKGHEALVGNLEGTFTTQASVAEQGSSMLRFTFDPHFADLLSGLGFTAVSLANNHALDFSREGYDETIKILNAADIGAFGSPFNNIHIAASLSLKDKKICMVGYHSLFNSDTAAVIEKIKDIRTACDAVVVMAHWGAEYQHSILAQQQEAAHAFIDAGADVVIGSHPHVVEPLEIYNNHAIFYSLGNFIFDQKFSSEVKRGLAVEVVFDASTTRFVLTPVTTYREVSVAPNETVQAVLADVITPELPPDITESILKTGSFELTSPDKLSPVQVI